VTQPFKLVDAKSAAGRIASIGLIAVAIGFGWLSIRWQLGNMLGSQTQPNAPNAASIAEVARDLSPNDPLTNWLQASVYKDDFSPDGLNRAVSVLETMVRNAPHDYRAWIELARALEQAEQLDRAEKAFVRSVELAPNYSYTHWNLGNFYLRRDRETEAMKEFRAAAESSVEYREQVFSIVWEYFEKDSKKLEEMAGTRPEVLIGLSKFYAARGLAPESLRIWNTLTAEQKQDHSDIALIITQALFERRFFRSAVDFARQLAIEPDAKLGTAFNGGFEAPLFEDAQKGYFNWKIVKLDKVDIKPDPLKKRSGSRSLRMNFTGFSGIEIKNLSQVAAVDASKRYRLSFWVRTENLKSAGTPLIEVVNANDDKIIATSAPFPTENNEWTEIKVDFTTPANAEGIMIRLDRAYCGDACPIVGTAWLDDFQLEAI
jgi:tetratricopeptide (TPR) repeat protein